MIGSRVLVWGSSCSGKSTLAAKLAERMHIPCVDLDALNWLPNWIGLNATDPNRLEERIRTATAGDAWVVAGSYTKQSQATFWPRLETIIWLDLPMRVLLYRVIKRSWQRWRNQELLWGTNYENFWDQLKVWKKEDSLVWWIVSRYHSRRRLTFEYITDPQWSHIQVLRFTRSRQVDDWLNSMPSKTASEPR
jgi:adenylate kinase family enzyme